MTATNLPTIDSTPRWLYIKYLWTQEYTALWLLPGLIMGLGAGFALGWLANETITADKLSNLFENFLPMLLGIGLTVAVLYGFDKWRDDKRDETRLKTELLWQIRSRVTDVAMSALDRLRVNGWLDLIDKQNLKEVKWSAADLRYVDLSGADMRSADLSGADMRDADLRGAHMRSANLSSADMWSADLSGAHMERANLNGAHLRDANLSGAHMGLADLSGTRMIRANLSNAHLLCANLSGAQMRSVNLSGAHMRSVNLSGAQMHSVNLRGPNLDVAQFDAQTQLPDETYWTAATDMTRFTDPDHPQFWRSDVAFSPAYRGNKLKA